MMKNKKFKNNLFLVKEFYFREIIKNKCKKGVESILTEI